MHEMVCLLGEPPSEFLERSLHTWRLFDYKCRFPHVMPVVVKSFLAVAMEEVLGLHHLPCLLISV